jgi:hypothetical protein
MKRRILVLAAIVALLLVGTVALAQSGRPYVVEKGCAAGGSYSLTSLTWQVSGASNGGDYRLFGPAAPALRGSGCCCTYLPIALRNAQ